MDREEIYNKIEITPFVVKVFIQSKMNVQFIMLGNI